MSNKYVDVTAITQIIGNVFNDATLLDNTDKYVISEFDFVEDFSTSSATPGSVQGRC